MVGASRLVERRYAQVFRMSRNGPLALGYHALFVTFMLAPIVVVCWVAFTPEGYLSFPTDRWSLRWFYAIAPLSRVHLGFLAQPLAGRAVVGDRRRLLGAGRARHRAATASPAARRMTALFMSPLMIPHVVLGIAFLRFFTEVGLGGTFAGLVLAHIVIVLPFALRLTLASAVGWTARSSMPPSRSALRTGRCCSASPCRWSCRAWLSGWALAFIRLASTR